MININNYKFKKIPKFKIDDIVFLKTTYSKTVPNIKIPNITNILTFSRNNMALLVQITDDIATLITNIKEQVFTNLLTQYSQTTLTSYTQTILFHRAEIKNSYKSYRKTNTTISD